MSRGRHTERNGGKQEKAGAAAQGRGEQGVVSGLAGGREVGIGTKGWKWRQVQSRGRKN